MSIRPPGFCPYRGLFSPPPDDLDRAVRLSEFFERIGYRQNREAGGFQASNRRLSEATPPDFRRVVRRIQEGCQPRPTPRSPQKDWRSPQKDWRSLQKDWRSLQKDWRSLQKDWRSPQKDWCFRRRGQWFRQRRWGPTTNNSHKCSCGARTCAHGNFAQPAHRLSKNNHNLPS